MRQRLAAVIFFLSLAAAPALACECPPLTAERSNAIIDNAAYIFEGAVVDMVQPEQPEEDFDYNAPMPLSENPLYAQVRLKIVTPYKGGEEGQRLDAWVESLTECGTLLQTGDVARFILKREGDTLIRENSCTDALWSSDFITKTIN